MPRIIQTDLWKAAQTLLAEHARAGHPPRVQYLLSGIVRCISSNANMGGQTTTHRNKAYGYYTCPHGSGGQRFESATKCHVKRLRQRELEAWVWTTLLRLAEHPELIQAELAIRREQNASEQSLIRNALAGLQHQMGRLKRQKADLLDLYLNRDGGHADLTREEYETKAAQLGEQIRLLDTQVADLEASLKTDSVSEDEAQSAIELLNAVRIANDRATFKDKRAILHLLDIHVLYDGDLIQLNGGVPTQKIVAPGAGRVS